MGDREEAAQAYPDLPENKRDFADQWQFPSKVKENLGASSWKVIRTTGTYKSGRPVDQVIFQGVAPEKGGDQDLRVYRRGMTLKSKKTGEPYTLCECP